MRACCTIFGSALVLLFANGAGASDWSWWQKYLTPGDAEIEVLAEPENVEAQGQNIVDDCEPPQVKNDTSLLDDEFNSIIAIGEKLWKIVEAGKPVVNFKTPLVHALPANALCWSELEKWRAPASEVRQVIYKNGFGINVVKFRFRTVYSAGGTLGGAGSYLANVTVLPESLDVAWGYSMNADVVVGRALNLGTYENPVAGLQLMVTWNVKTVLKDITASESIFVRAD